MSEWRRLASFVTRRRADLGLSQLEVSHRSDLSLDRLQCIEGAKRDGYRLGTLASLERALDWEPGSVDAILAGREPTPKPEPPAAEPGQGLSAILECGTCFALVRAERMPAHERWHRPSV